MSDTPQHRHTRLTDVAENEPENKKIPRRSPAALIVLIWIVITAAVFGAFYYMDTHVTSEYGGWAGFVRQITDSYNFV